MKERLIELMKNAEFAYLDFSKMHTCEKSLTDFTADYLLANGVVCPPCKVGDKVFYVNEVCDENADEYLDISVGEVISFSMQKEGLWMYCRYEDGLTYWHLVADDFGKTVFLTKEEAEQALKGGVESCTNIYRRCWCLKSIKS